MVAVEVVLILIGVAFLIGSYFVEEKLSQKDVEQISLMSEVELKTIVEKQVRNARVQVENSVEEIIDESLQITKRGLEKETNEKIMAVSDYSDTVMESMNNTHNEIMFLYSMLNDKQAEMTELVNALKKYSKMSAPVEESVSKEEDTAHSEAEAAAAAAQPAAEEQSGDVLSDENAQEMEESLLINKNDLILRLHKEGKGEVAIAKTLNCGLGEVRLVLGLYKEGQN